MAHENGTVAGWGKTDEMGGVARILQEVNVTILTNDECKKVQTIGEHITDSMLCAYSEGQDACQGDSGGPFLWKSRDRVEQIGVVSWGLGCAKQGTPGKRKSIDINTR